MPPTRRLALLNAHFTAPAQPAPASQRKPRLAIITTSFHFRSHGQHEGDRFIVGYPDRGRWPEPTLEVVSMYADQKPTEAGNVGDPNGSVGDLSAERAEQFGFTVYDTIADALRCGGEALAVDAVLIVGEHGEYPYNELGQHLLPRYESRLQEIPTPSRDSSSHLADRRRASAGSKRCAGSGRGLRTPPGVGRREAGARSCSRRASAAARPWRRFGA